AVRVLRRLRVDRDRLNALPLALLDGRADLGHRPAGRQQLAPARPRLRLGHADPAQRRIDIEGVSEDAVADPAGFAVEQVGGDDLEIVVGGMGEGAAAIAVAQRPDTRHICREALVDLDVAARIGGDPRLVEIEITRVRPPAYRQQHIGADYLGIALGTLDPD